jgi:hypothetical protein
MLTTYPHVEYMLNKKNDVSNTLNLFSVYKIQRNNT